MPTINNNLFPPVVKDSQRSFVRTQNCRIYFSLSQYNNIDDIKNVQISLVNQKTNASALNPTKYPSAIKIVDKGTNNFHYDATIKDDYKYYIEIEPNAVLAQSDLVTNYFELNQYYLVQMRFTSSNSNVPDPPANNGLDTWLFNNRDYFSEWSTICLIKGIDNPEILITGLEETGVTTLTSPLSRISGKLVYSSLEKFSTSWVRKTAESGDIISNSTTRICSTDYIDVTSYLYMLFEVNSGYKYIIQCYNAQKEWLGTNYTIDWTTEKRKLFIDENIYYILITLAKTNNAAINTGVRTNLTIKSSSVSVNKSQTEYLKSYYITVYETSKGINNLTYKSQEIYTNQYKPNEFNYEIPYEFDRGINYTLAFVYTTNNLYTNTLLYKFIIANEIQNKLDGVLTITPEEQNGRIKIDIDFQHTIQTDNNLVIKRSSYKTNFKIWETIKQIPHNLNSLRHVWYDTTIESGVWYKYRIQQNENDNRLIDSDNPIICTFEDIFLTNGQKQLKVRFNPSIGDFKYNVMDSQQTTLGSQYPFVRRNGNNYFRSFSIGGLISSFIDDNDWYSSYYQDGKFRIENKREFFASSQEIYKDSKNLYEDYNSQNDINIYQDYVYEREFRQKVSDFLYENNIKLFRSLTEGNILIKLQNVSFQPVDALGRRLYSFTATAVEIDDFTIANFIKYNIINKYYYSYKIGVIQGYFNGKESVIDKILSTSSLSQYNKEIFKIFKLDIELKQSQNAVFYLKTINDDQMIRYETQFGILTLDFDKMDQPIEDCYFYGVHLNENQYTLTNNYYYNEEEAPKTAGIVCYIYDSPIEGENVYKINNYISYDKRERLLTTEEKETAHNVSKNPNYYVLLLDGIYQRYIYYNNAWYPFSDTGDVLIRTNAKITYYYEIKEEN